MPKISIRMNPVNSLKLRQFKVKLKGNMRKALTQIGWTIAKQAKRNISGLGFSRNPNRSSKYFGIKSGSIFASLKSRLEPSGDTVVIGSNENYVRFVIPAKFGGAYKGQKITGHYLADTLDQKDVEIDRIFAGKIWKPLK